MNTLVHDLKHTIRMLRRTPGFTLTAIAALALGIGANTAIFSVVNAVLLKPLPYPDPDRIVQLMGVTPQGNFAVASVPMYNIWREQTQALEDVAAYDNGGPGINIGGGDRPEQVKGIHVSHEFFRLFGVPVPLGRAFTAEEDRPARTQSCGDLRRAVASPLRRRSQHYRQADFAGTRTVHHPRRDGPRLQSSSASPDLLLPFQADPQ